MGIKGQSRYWYRMLETVYVIDNFEMLVTVFQMLSTYSLNWKGYKHEEKVTYISNSKKISSAINVFKL